MNNYRDITNPTQGEELALRIICSFGLIFSSITLLFGLLNLLKIFRKYDLSSKTLTLLFYLFSILEILATCFFNVWYIIKPNIQYDASKVTLLNIEAAIAPAYWGIYLSVSLSTYQLGLSI